MTAEALDFIEVEGALLWENLVDSDACDRLVRSVVHFVETQGCLSCIHQELSSLRLELPRDLIFSVTHEDNLPLAEDIDLFLWRTVVLSVLAHREAKRLAYNVVKGHRQEVGSQ